MPFIHSLLCFKGVDNRQRFLSLTLGFYFCFMLFSAMSASSITFSIIGLIVFVSLASLTALRRIHDANLHNKWLIGSCLTFLIVALIIVFTESASFYWLMLIPAGFSALLLTYPSKGKQRYILGYAGPVNLNIYQEVNHAQQRRIEPTLVGETSTTFSEQQNIETEPLDTVYQSTHSHQANTEKSPDIGEVIRKQLIKHRKIVIALLAVLSITITVILIWQNIGEFKQAAEPTAEVPEVIKNKIEKSHQITLPDNFSIWLSPHSGLIVNWQAKASDKQKIWSLTTGKGDTDCQDIEFNNGKKYRTLAVVIEDDIQRYAQFSPVDTQALVQDIAFRGSFELCGYTFSLKGSQSALGKSAAYAEWVVY